MNRILIADKIQRIAAQLRCISHLDQEFTGEDKAYFGFVAMMDRIADDVESLVDDFYRKEANNGSQKKRQDLAD